MIMKKGLTGIFILAIIMGISLISCEEDLLDINSRDGLEGTWNAEEDNNLKSVDYYDVTISKSASDSTVIRIDNFYALDEIVEAEVSTFTLNIPQQTVSGFTIKGYGSVISMKKIEWSYTVDHHNGFVDQVTATYTR
jgi:hypothetical protein